VRVLELAKKIYVQSASAPPVVVVEHDRMELTFRNVTSRVGTIAIARQVLLDRHPVVDLLLEEIDLVREEDDGRLLEHLGRDDLVPEYEGVLETIDAAVLLELLVEARDGSQEDDSGNVLEEREPSMPLVVQREELIV
jgi:hypothetical protein